MTFGNPIFGGSVALPGALIPQEGESFRTTEWGYDEGERKWLTHPNTPRNAWPKRDQQDSQYTKMYVREVVPRKHESGLIELTAYYKGLISIDGTVNKERLRSGGDTQLFSVSALSNGNKINLVAPVPKDVLSREYVTTSTPTRNGVGSSASGAFLGSLANFLITYLPDPDAGPPSLNYLLGWVLDNREWEDIAKNVFLVRERYGYYYNLAV